MISREQIQSQLNNCLLEARFPQWENLYKKGKVRDMYLLDESSVSLPYLGREGPTVLDIPIGIAGQLTHLYIIFGMWGLAVKAPIFSNKVRVKVA